MSKWASLHTHSHHSSIDGTTPVRDLVAKAKMLGYPFLGLSDHGNMAGVTKLYKACREYDILPYPGVEAYLYDPMSPYGIETKEASKAERYHVGLYARTERGYQGLVKLVSLSHTRPRFSRFPRLTLDDLIEYGAEYGDDMVLTTGCFFGWAQQTLVKTDDPSAAQGVIQTYAQHFPHTFVEVQNHSIDHDDGEWTDEQIVHDLIDIAEHVSLPVIATQDSHYLNQNQKAAHSLMKRMVYGGADDSFPGDSFHLASDEWVEEHYAPGDWNRVLEGCDHLVQLNEVQISPLDKYEIRMPSMNSLRYGAKTADEQLEGLVMVEHDMNSDQRYHDRLVHELEVIQKLGMADYFLHWADAVEWCHAEGICIEARGSANGSYVCYLLGITQVDPLKWGLLFERFLSEDRTKPPDIDMDIEDGRRQELLEYLDAQYRTTRIGTWSQLGSNDEGTGSIMQTWKTYRARQQEDDDARKSIYARYQSLTDVKRDFPEDYTGLVQLDQMKSVYRSYGVHAAGVLLSGSDFNVRDWIPTMLVASSNTEVTQYDMDDVEEWGLLKDDILGQATLTVMRICQEHIGRDDPTDFSWIDDDDKKACALLREGRVDTGIFHFEGWTKSKGGKELGISYTKDSIMAQALYMPGAMDTGQKDLYIERKRDPQKRREVQYIHRAFEKALRYTYGAVIFQEQVIEIMRNLGMSIAAINVFFKVVKDSGRGATERNRERLSKVREEFDRHCVENGIADTDAAWEMTAGFVAYGFNKAHATGYGVRAYRCAYLKAHYPLEFMAALLEVWSGREKEDIYVKEARRQGLRCLSAHVNRSKVAWSLDRKYKALRKGLLSIKGVGLTAAEDIIANAPYTSVQDLVERCKGRTISGGKDFLRDGSYTGRLAQLRDAGALDGLQERHED